MRNDFCIFILTHGRPDNVITYHTLERMGNTYPIFFIVDNEDKTVQQYIDRYKKDRVILIDKKLIAKTFDQGDNSDDRRSIVYARNACFDIAKRLGFQYFLELDDDYREFKYRINNRGEHPQKRFTVKKNLNYIFESVLSYYEKTPFLSIALSQGGDWFGGASNFGKPSRKAMNTFFCCIDRPFQFIGRINEDVNTYTCLQARGGLFLTIPFIQIDQIQTQASSGGMSDIYKKHGTYQKSFFTIMYSPSCTRIAMMGETHRRIHHLIKWENAVPKIINQKYRKDKRIGEIIETTRGEG